MLSKAWGWLRARLGGQPQRRLRFSVHRHMAYPSFWRPALASDPESCLEVQIYLEASNMTGAPRWITAAEIEGATPAATVIGVRDARTGTFAADNPLPPRQIAVVSLHFLFAGQSQSDPSDEPFRATLLLTDQLGERHQAKVILH
jgi:hypothetical protein